jgi:succinate-semialdehyde dehydrogenase / glutarate-semialdehyde dehydrogenase
MQVPDVRTARDLVADTPNGVPGLPPRLSPGLLRQLAEGATLVGGSHEVHEVRAPFTGRVAGRVWLAGPEDVSYAVERARRAQKAWAARPVRERAAVLLRLHDLVHERMHVVMDLIQLEAGKARMDAFVETMDVAIVARYYGLHGPKLLAGERRAGFLPLLTQTSVGYHPKGVVGVIGPWNYPFTMAISDALAALLAGNAVVLKPAEQTPLTALYAARLLYEAGLPAEVLHVVPGHGSEIGTPLIESVDFLQFTGSTETGRIVAEQAGAHLVGSSMELGGKNPLIVRHDADLRRALPGVLQACFSSTGQLCISAERVYVHESLYETFLAESAAATEALVMNARYDFSAHVGSLVSEEQLEKVTEHVEDARQQGATVVTGGHPRPDVGPYFYAPTILTGVHADMAVYREETFGPVAAVYPFATDEEAIARANDSEYGLHASVWTRDLAAGRAMAGRLECGTVSVNDAYVSAWGSAAAPMGGFKASGLGRRHGPEGLLKFTEPQTVSVQLFGPLAADHFGVTQEVFAEVTRHALRLLRHLPGLR